MVRNSVAVGCIILFLLPMLEIADGTPFFGPWIRIEDFDIPNEVIAGQNFSVNVTVQNNLIFPRYLWVRIDLLDELGLVDKEIGRTNGKLIWLKPYTFEDISCLIREGDIDWYMEKYNLRANVMLSLPGQYFSHRDIGSPEVRGVHVKTRFWEKEKVRIVNMSTPEKLEIDQFSFNVTVTVKNDGVFPADALVRVDLIEKPSMIPGFEEYNLPEGFGEVRKEIGSVTETIGSMDEREFVVDCGLRETEKDKDEFNIEAVLLVNVSGQLYKVSSSTIQGICREASTLETWEERLIQVSIVLGIILLIVVIIFLIAVIIRILYPLYKIKREEIKERVEVIGPKKP